MVRAADGVSHTSPVDAYDTARDGLIWCVEIDHPEHLIFAQRAHLKKETDVVTKQSRPIIVSDGSAQPRR